MTTTHKPANSTLGKMVTYTFSAIVEEVSGSVRNQARPDDKEELVEEQVSYGEETILLGGPDSDPLFTEQLNGCQVGDIRSFVYTYPDYDRDNLISLPVDFLVANGIPAAKVQVGHILNKDILKNQVKVAGTATDLEIISLVSNGGREFAILDSNDPLRGLTVRYDCEIVEVREPTQEELEGESI